MGEFAVPQDKIDQMYLPFTPDELLEHFAPVGGRGDPARYLTYYLKSKRNREESLMQRHPGSEPLDAHSVRLGNQMEKDERFWVVAALMGMSQATDPVAAFAGLLTHCEGLELPIGGHDTWEEALGNSQHLYFETNLPSPPSYRQFLRAHLTERSLSIPNLRQAAEARSDRLEGATKVDALLVAPETGFAVLFEAKVLADISTGIEFDVLRNQMARNIDVMLDENPRLRSPLSLRRPDKSCFVLLTPEVFRSGHRESRLYGWLFDEYKRDPALLRGHLPHRPDDVLAGVPSRLGWLTWEDCNRVRPGTCAWLDDR